MSFWITKDTPDKERAIRNVVLAWNPAADLKNIIFLPGGSSSIAVRAGEVVYRFPQTEEAFAAMRREAAVTGILKQNFSLFSETAEVLFVDQAEDGFPRFSRHRYISGKIIDNRYGETDFSVPYVRLSEQQKNKLAEKTAAFLSGLHSLPTKLFQNISAPPVERNLDFTRRIDERLSRMLLSEATNGQVDLKDFKTESSCDAVFCHNDLSGSNLLADLNKDDVLAGVIDFGNAGVFPRTNEFIPFYKIGREFVCRIIKAYNKISPIRVGIREIDYKFLCFVCFLLERQKKPSFF